MGKLTGENKNSEKIITLVIIPVSTGEDDRCAIDIPTAVAVKETRINANTTRGLMCSSKLYLCDPRIKARITPGDTITVQIVKSTSR